MSSRAKKLCFCQKFTKRRYFQYSLDAAIFECHAPSEIYLQTLSIGLSIDHSKFDDIEVGHQGFVWEIQ